MQEIRLLISVCTRATSVPVKAQRIPWAPLVKAFQCLVVLKYSIRPEKCGLNVKGNSRCLLLGDGATLRPELARTDFEVGLRDSVHLCSSLPPSAMTGIMCSGPFSAVAKTFAAVIWPPEEPLVCQEAVLYGVLARGPRVSSAPLVTRCFRPISRNLRYTATDMGQPTMWKCTKCAHCLLVCLSVRVVNAGLLFLERHGGHFSLVCHTQ